MKKDNPVSPKVSVPALLVGALGAVCLLASFAVDGGDPLAEVGLALLAGSGVYAGTGYRTDDPLRTVNVRELGAAVDEHGERTVGAPAARVGASGPRPGARGGRKPRP